MQYYKHESTIIDERAIIGKGTKIWHFCHVMGTAVIGENCILGQNVFVGNKVSLGDRVKVQNNVSLYEGVRCEEDVFIGPSVVFTNVSNPRSFIERKDEFRSTLIKRGASIGANATILCGVTIGEYALIGAGAVVIRDVEPHALVVGNPSIQKGWVSEAGEKLIFDEHGIAVCKTDQSKYQLINGKLIKLMQND